MEFEEFQFDDNIQYSVRLEDDETFQDWCARRIQAWYRGRKTRRAFMKMRMATILIQVRWRRALTLIRAQPDLNENARIIQDAWKKYWYRKVFVYYKNLIDFRQRGTPATLLRSINPAEAQLAEAAAGLHVRFRLGGSTFPPLIFYKIYTHRPVTDIGAFAPRDYVEEKKPKPRIEVGENFTIPEELLECFNMDGSVKATKREDMGWYLRTDSNGWRPIAERLFYEEDPVERYTSAKKMNFSHIPLVRKELLKKKRREKKLNWMQKMYKDGMGGGVGASLKKVSPIPEEGERPGVMVKQQRQGEGVAGHREVEEGNHPDALTTLGDEELDFVDDEDLLDWSENLDFDDYYSEWIKQSCSNGSETIIPLPTKEYHKKATIDSFRSFERESFEREVME